MERFSKMDKFSEQFHRYLQLAHSSALLVSQSDKANIEALLSLLGPDDHNMMMELYGLFGFQQATPEEEAAKYDVTVEDINERVKRDLRLLAITPEWQIMLRKLRPVVLKRISPNPTD